MEIADFQIEIKALKDVLDSSHKKYYHLNSIENFLFHFNSLNNDNREIVLRLLIQCFDYYRVHSIRNIYESLDVFQIYLKPIGKIYESQLGFSIYIKPWLFLLYIIPGYVLIYYIFDNNHIILYIFSVIVLSFIVCFFLKVSNKKLYAFLW
jgi:hypothetical protein